MPPLRQEKAFEKDCWWVDATSKASGKSKGKGKGGKDKVRQLEGDTAAQAGAPSVVPSVSPQSSVSHVAGRRVQALATPPEEGQREEHRWVMALSVPMF